MVEVMEVKIDIIQDAKNDAKNTHVDSFHSELVKSYLESEIAKKKELLNEYSNAYDKLDDKDSFNAQYLKTLIDVLRDEI